MESERLNSFRFNQDKLRVEQNALLREALANEVDPGNVGRISIMPSSFTNSKRYLTEYAQDGMINIRVYGRGKLSDHDRQPGVARDEGGPLPGHSPSHSLNRQDVTARVFRRKVVKLMELIRKGKISDQ